MMADIFDLRAVKTGILTGIAVFALMACSVSESGPVSSPPAGPAAPVNEAEACKAKGGSLQQAGLLGREYCVIRFQDAGKACTDGSQCEGDCWATPKAYGPNENVSGTCQPTNMPFGCNARVTDGKAGPVLCVD